MGGAILVTGTDTGVGKTYVSCLLGRQAAGLGIRVRPLKPVESGCAPGAGGRPFPADAAALRGAIAPDAALDEICLYRLAAPVSPHLAARAERVDVDPARVREAVSRAASLSDLVIVEGAGGIAVEIRDGYSFADLARDLALPVLVVAGNRLGVLSHLRLTLSFLGSGGIPVLGVVLNDCSPGPFPARESNGDEVARIAGDRYLGRVPWAAERLPDDLFARFRETAFTRTLLDSL